jgi:NitT/TauT family transport system permease protein
MSLLRTFSPTRGVLARPGRSVANVIVFLGGPPLLWLNVRLAHGVTVPWDEVTAHSAHRPG